MLGTAHRLAAGIILEIQDFENNPPALAEQKAPDKGKMLLSVEVLAEPDQPFLSRTKLGGRTIQVQGTLRRGTGDTWRASYQFSDTTSNPDGTVSTNSWSSNLDLSTGKPILASGGSRGTTFIQIKAAPEK